MTGQSEHKSDHARAAIQKSNVRGSHDYLTPSEITGNPTSKDFRAPVWIHNGRVSKAHGHWAHPTRQIFWTLLIGWSRMGLSVGALFRVRDLKTVEEAMLIAERYYVTSSRPNVMALEDATQTHIHQWGESMLMPYMSTLSLVLKRLVERSWQTLNVIYFARKSNASNAAIPGVWPEKAFGALLKQKKRTEDNHARICFSRELPWLLNTTTEEASWLAVELDVKPFKASVESGAQDLEELFSRKTWEPEVVVKMLPHSRPT